MILSTGLEEEAVPVGRILARLAFESAELGRPFAAPAVLIGCGGESTVKLGADDEFGRGGPNQEAALAAATVLDGSDVSRGLHRHRRLRRRHRPRRRDQRRRDPEARRGGRGRRPRRDRPAPVRRAVAALGDGIDTGPTHTNVNDLFAMAIGDGRG